MAAVFPEIGKRLRSGGTNEFEIQQWLMEAFRREDLIADVPPIVAVNRNSGDPHYAPTANENARIREGDFVLLDVWGKKNNPRGGITTLVSWTGFVGRSAPDRIREIFDIGVRSRDAGIEKVTSTIALGKHLSGSGLSRAQRRRRPQC
jgi:Xaa-Pro dipeptidase